MKNPLIKHDSEDKLKELGYKYSIMEGGYISSDAATVVSINRAPYKRQVMRFMPKDKEHQINVEKLRAENLLED